MAMGPLSLIGQSAARAGVPRSLYVLTVTIVMATVWLVADQGRTDQALRELLGAAPEVSPTPALRGRRLMEAEPPAVPTLAPVTAPPLPTAPPAPTMPPAPTLPPPVTVAPVTVAPVTVPPTDDLPAPAPAPAPAPEPTTPAPPTVSVALTPSTSDIGSYSGTPTNKGELSQQQLLEQQQQTSRLTGSISIGLSLLYGAFYFCMVVQNYPEWEKGSKPTPEAKEFMEKDEVSASCEALGEGQCCNCLLSWLCGPARAAHTMDKVGILSYWPALILMSCGCRFCLLCWANAFTDMNKRLGGKKRGCCMSFLCTFFCSCCVIYQDAVALDMNTGAETGCCGVTEPEGNDGGSESE